MNITNKSFLASLLLSLIFSTQAFVTPTISRAAFLSQPQQYQQFSSSSTTHPSTFKLNETTEDQIISPFEQKEGEEGEASPSTGDEILDLTWENVDLVLEEMRPYLIQDGGNVRIDDIDGPVVKLQLEGACGTCPSSTQTMKMGLERKLKEKIPEIQEVIQAMPEGPPLSMEEVNVVLDGVRPFLSVAGGSIDCESIMGEGSVQPIINLKMEGNSKSLNSVKLEISQRLQRHFMVSGLRVEWL